MYFKKILPTFRNTYFGEHLSVDLFAYLKVKSIKRTSIKFLKT